MIQLNPSSISLLFHAFVLLSWLLSDLNAFTPSLLSYRKLCLTNNNGCNIYNFNNNNNNNFYNSNSNNNRNGIQVHNSSKNNNKKNLIQLNLSASSPSSSSLPNVQEMKASELRKELQSYGMSTKSFFEKSELVEAVEKARAEGKTPISDTSDHVGTDKKSSSSASSTDTSSTSTATDLREERLAKEIDICNKMKVGDLKKELESYGISTKSFFEKSEFVKAVAEARVDGVKSRSASSRGSTRSSREEEYDPSYKDVKMQKMDRRTLMGSSPVIDVRLG